MVLTITRFSWFTLWLFLLHLGEVLTGLIDNSLIEEQSLYLRHVPENWRHGQHLQVGYSCPRRGKDVASQFLNAQLLLEHEEVLFTSSVQVCGDADEDHTFMKSFQLVLPWKYACDDAIKWRKAPRSVANLQLWISSNHQRRENFWNSSVNTVYSLPLYETDVPCNSNTSHYCPSIYYLLRRSVSNVKRSSTSYCAADKEQFALIRFPVALASNIGFVFTLPGVRDADYRQDLLHTSRAQVITISMWLYLKSSACLSEFCTLVNVVNNVGKLRSPSVVLTRDNKLQVQALSHSRVKSRDGLWMDAFDSEIGVSMAAKINEFIPAEQWLHFVLHWTDNKWRLILKTIEGQVVVDTAYTFNHMPEIRDVVPGQDLIVVVGSADSFSAPLGFVAELHWIRGRLAAPSRLPQLPKQHPVLRGLQLDNTALLVCNLRQGEIRLYALVEQARKKLFSNQCARNITWIHYFNASQICHTISEKPHTFMEKLLFKDLLYCVRRHNHARRDILRQCLANQRYQAAIRAVEEGGLRLAKRASLSLETAIACWPAHEEATYILATMYNFGVGQVPIDEDKALSLLLRNVASLHRLTLMALANKHLYGNEGAPYSMEIAHGYFAAGAILIQNDREQMRSDEQYVENVYLSNEKALAEQTHEQGELFHWLHHQAEQYNAGWARRHLARILFWGQQGVRRNVSAAEKHYREAVRADPTDAEAMYDYGVLLLKQPDKNKSEAIKWLTQAMQLNNSAAVNALGWYAETFLHDSRLAFARYQQARKMQNANAAHNLGIYYHEGRAPLDKPNYSAALREFYYASNNGILAASYMLSKYLAFGLATPRDPPSAMEWTRYSMEQSPALGRVLHRALQAYLGKQVERSAFYYLLAAHAGVDVAIFNLAWLCEESASTGQPLFFSKDCVYRLYNISAQRTTSQVNPLSLIKMGDAAWYLSSNFTQAFHWYMRAAVEKAHSMAFYNLAHMLELDLAPSYAKSEIVTQFERNLRWSRSSERHELPTTHELVLALYARCEEVAVAEDYLPCRLASWRAILRHSLSFFVIPLHFLWISALFIIFSFIVGKFVWTTGVLRTSLLYSLRLFQRQA